MHNKSILKASLNIPQTTFPIRANLNLLEKRLQAYWDKINLPDLVNHANLGQDFTVFDGPAYANGKIHYGTAMNKILKDFIIRSQAGLFDKKVYLTLGWDVHGLPIENAVLKKYRDLNRSDLSKIRLQCEAYVKTQVEIQKNQFHQLGLLTDFNNYYLTNNFSYELFQLEIFKALIAKKILFKSLKPVYWSWSSQSALAEAEIEYKNIESPAIYVSFVLLKNNYFPINTNLIIWTTTPWTLPSNKMLAVNLNMNYVLIKTTDKYFIVAEALVENIVKLAEIKNYEIIEQFEGQKLIGLLARHPFYNFNVPVVEGHHVTNDVGTGIVHIAPGFGVDDYLIGKKHNIKPFAPINEKGVFTAEINDPDLDNVFYKKANDIVITKLQNNNHLFFQHNVNHSYPIDWRTKKEVIFRSTSQWFLLLEDVKESLKVAIAKNIKWHPQWAEGKMQEMITNRYEWCISRQRSWGVPIIAFYDNSNKVYCDTEILDFAYKKFVKHQSCNIWYTKPANYFLPAKYHSLNLKKEKDTMDVWFDSGIAAMQLQNQIKKTIPWNLALEGKDQFRGWFNSSLILTMLHHQQIPFDNIYVHGFIVDELGNKLSKSQKNFMPLENVIQNYGADVLRLWVASVDFTHDLKIGNHLLEQIKKQYLKIRNTFRFLLGNLSDFDFNLKFSIQELSFVNQYIILKLAELEKKLLKYYQNANFIKVTKILQNFIIFDLSNFYLNITKDILYVNQKNSQERRQIQFVYFIITRFLLDYFKPILCHTTEEIYEHLQLPNKQASCFLEKRLNIKTLINAITEDEQGAIIKAWNVFFTFKAEINKAQEQAKIDQKINRTLEMDVTVIYYDKNDKDFLTLKAFSNLHDLLLVNKVIWKFSASHSNNDMTNNAKLLSIKITPANGVKCMRCWKITENYINNTELCSGCNTIMNDFKN